MIGGITPIKWFKLSKEFRAPQLRRAWYVLYLAIADPVSRSAVRYPKTVEGVAGRKRSVEKKCLGASDGQVRWPFGSVSGLTDRKESTKS